MKTKQVLLWKVIEIHHFAKHYIKSMIDEGINSIVIEISDISLLHYHFLHRRDLKYYRMFSIRKINYTHRFVYIIRKDLQQKKLFMRNVTFFFTKSLHARLKLYKLTSFEGFIFINFYGKYYRNRKRDQARNENRFVHCSEGNIIL